MGNLKPTPVKFCALKSCGKKLERKKFPRAMETLAKFRQRQYCGPSCWAEALELRVAERSLEALSTGTLKNMARGTFSPGPCAKCGRAAEEIHHKDRNSRNLSPENLIRLCRACHLKEHGKEEVLGRHAYKRDPNAACLLCGRRPVHAKGLCQTHYMTDLRHRKREG